MSNHESESRGAAFFDLDKTIIAKSSSLAFSRPFYRGGLITRATVLRSAYSHLLFMAAGADHEQMEKMREHLSQLVKGWNVAQVREIVQETMDDLIFPVVYHEATALIAEHQAAGRDVVVVSSSGTDIVEPISELLGVDHVIATRMQIADGKYTGEFEFYAYAENKALAIQRYAADHGYELADCYAYSDSATDEPMLAAVGHPTAVNPDRALRKIATERDWPIVVFAHPTPLRNRVADQVPGLPASSVAPAAVTLGALGLLWWLLTRRPNRA